MALFAKNGRNYTACLLALLFLSGCEPTSTPQPRAPTIEPKSAERLTRAIYLDTWQLDPHFVRSEAEGAPLRDLLRGLLAFNEKGEPVADLAQSWSTEDGKNWLFQLDEHAKWSNGEAVTANDIVASWQRLANPQQRSPLARYLRYLGLENAEAVLAGEKSAEALGVKAISATELHLQLIEPNFQLPQMLAHIALLPTYQGAKPQVSGWISNGAYRLEGHDEKRLQLKATNSETAFQQVEYQRVENIQNVDRFDVVENPLPAYVRGIQRFPRLCHYYYEFNFTDPLLAQKPIRQAIRAMLSPVEIAEGHGIPSYFAVPPSLLTMASRPLVQPSSEQFALGRVMELQLSYDLHAEHSLLAERIIRSLGRSELFRISPQPMSWNELLNVRDQQRFQLSRAGWCADYSDPVAFLRPFHSASPDNKSRYANQIVDEALEKLMLEQDFQVRERLILSILHALEEDVALLPLFQYQRRISLDSTLKGFDIQNSSEVIYSKDLYRQSRTDNEPTDRTATHGN